MGRHGLFGVCPSSANQRVWTAIGHASRHPPATRHRITALLTRGSFHPESAMVHRRCVLAGGLALAALGAGIRGALAQSQAMAPAPKAAQPGPFRLEEAARF